MINFPKNFHYDLENLNKNTNVNDFLNSLDGKKLCEFFKCAMKDIHYLSSHPIDAKSLAEIISQREPDLRNYTEKNVNKIANQRFTNSQIKDLLNDVDQIEINEKNLSYLLEVANKFKDKDLLIKLFTQGVGATYSLINNTVSLDVLDLEEPKIESLEKYRSLLTNANIKFQINLKPFLPQNLNKVLDQFKDNIYEIQISSGSDMYLPTIFEKAEGLKNLQILSIKYSNLNKIPEEIKNLTNLKQLNLENCKFKEIPDLSNLKNLQTINIDACNVLKTLPKFESLPFLQSININKCPIEEFPPLYNLTSLNTLIIKNCFQLKDLHLGNSINLKSLELNLSSLNTISGLKNLTNLEVLELKCSRLNTQEINQIENFKELHTLIITNRYLCDLSKSIGKLKNLKLLELSHCPLKDLPSEIGLLKNLQTLRFNECCNLKKLPKEIGDLEKLHTLSVIACGLKQLPKEVGRLKQLNELTFVACPITFLPKEIGELQGLEILNLKNCESLIELPSNIGFLKNLRSLSLNNSWRLKDLPKEVENLVNLQYFSFSGCNFKSTQCNFRHLNKLENVDLQCKLSTKSRLEILFALFKDRSIKGYKYPLEKLIRDPNPENLNINLITHLGMVFYNLFESIDAQKFVLDDKNTDNLILMGLWIDRMKDPNTVVVMEDFNEFKSLLSKILNNPEENFSWINQCAERASPHLLQKRLNYLSELVFKFPLNDSPIIDKNLAPIMLSVVKINHVFLFNEVVNALIGVHKANNLDALKKTTITLSNCSKKEIIKPHLNLINLALVYGNINSELKDKILQSLNNNFYKDTHKSNLFAETIIRIIKSSLDLEIKEKVLKMLLLPPEMEKGVTRGAEFKAKEKEFKKRLIDFRADQTKYVKEIKALILIDQVDSLAGIDHIEEVETILKATFKDKFFIKEENVDKFLELSDEPRYPNAFFLYGSTIYSHNERDMLMPAFGAVVNSVIENNYLSKKFKDNPHMEKVFKKNAELFEIWKDSITIQLEGPTNIKIHDVASWVNYLLSGTEVEKSCQNIQGNPELCKTLLALLMDPKLKMVAVEDMAGKTIGRRIIRILFDPEKKQPAILMEQCYYRGKNKQKLEELTTLGCIEKAKAMNLPLLKVRSDEEKVATPDYHAYKGKLKSLGSPAPYEYVDSGQRGITNGQYTIGDLENEQIEILWEPT